MHVWTRGQGNDKLRLGIFSEDHKRAAYIVEEVFQWVVEGSKDFGFLDRAVWSVSQHLVALEHGCWVTPAHLLQVVETSRTPLTISSGGVG